MNRNYIRSWAINWTRNWTRNWTMNWARNWTISENISVKKCSFFYWVNNFANYWFQIYLKQSSLLPFTSLSKKNISKFSCVCSFCLKDACMQTLDKNWASEKTLTKKSIKTLKNFNIQGLKIHGLICKHIKYLNKNLKYKKMRKNWKELKATWARTLHLFV